MFGPLSRAGRATARNSRRRATFAVLIVLILCLIVGEIIDQVVDAQNSVDTRTEATFVAAMVPIVRQSNSLMPLLGEIRNAPSSLGAEKEPRAVLAELLVELQQGSAAANSAYTNLGLAAPNLSAAKFIHESLESRVALSNDLASGIQSATSGEIGAAQTSLRQVSALLVTSDRDYTAFLALLPKISHGIKLPTSKWNQPQRWTTPATNNWVQALANSNVLAAKQGVKIVAVALDPAAVSISGIASPTTTTTTTTTSTSTTTTTTLAFSNVSTSSTLPFLPSTTTTTTTIPVTTTTNQIPPLSSTSNLPSTSTVAVTVVIASSGNVPLANVVVTASLTPTSSPSKKHQATASSEKVTIANLAASGARYLPLGKLPVVAGANYRLVVTAQPKLGTPASATIKVNIG